MRNSPLKPSKPKTLASPGFEGTSNLLGFALRLVAVEGPTSSGRFELEVEGAVWRQSCRRAIRARAVGTASQTLKPKIP